MKCTHNDCLSCPYPECIYDNAKASGKKPKRTHDRSEYWAEYYQKNKERIKKRMLAHYHANKPAYSEQRKEAYKKKKKTLSSSYGDISDRSQ